jgi:hypothetical protein
MEEILLPLFPLELVLFPEESLPLHMSRGKELGTPESSKQLAAR